VAQRIQAIAQTGLTSSTDPWDVERYSELAAIAASMTAGPQPERIVLATGLFAASHGYATPKVVREREDGCWSLPGGWAEVGQSAAESVEREVVRSPVMSSGP